MNDWIDESKLYIADTQFVFSTCRMYMLQIHTLCSAKHEYYTKAQITHYKHTNYMLQIESVYVANAKIIWHVYMSSYIMCC